MSVSLDVILDNPEDAANDEPVRSIHREEMKEIFALLDADGSGNIDPKEIRMQMQALGFEADNTTIYQLISDMDTDGSQNLEFEEFVKILKDMEVHSVRYATRDNMQEVFDFLDDLEPQKRDKRIDSSNLKRIAQVLGDNISDAEIDVMIEEADRNGKGYVTAEDFYVMMSGEAMRMKEAEDVVETSALEKRASSKVSQRWRRAVLSEKVDSVIGDWKISTEKQLQAADNMKASKVNRSSILLQETDARSSSKHVRNRSASRDAGQPQAKGRPSLTKEKDLRSTSPVLRRKEGSRS